MKRINYYLNLIIGFFLLFLSSFFGLIITLTVIGNMTIFGVDSEILGLILIGHNGTSSMVPVFLGLLCLSGA